MSEIPFLDLYRGNKGEFEENSKAYNAVVDLLASKATTYGLPSTPEELDEEQQGILNDLAASIQFISCWYYLNSTDVSDPAWRYPSLPTS